ncbi:DUF1016 N-terminal domain-containing protein [Pedobacter sp. MW01-1-1]|uniref:DUF1016 N-terminal domain-containing protein n=1 Tax=Pedobacter sp. MW01-1-1 TaxID=3383027 RepID=UPI003FEEF8E9
MLSEKNETLRFHTLLLENLNQVTERQRIQLLGTINFGINNLFWEIGKTLNNALKENVSHKKENPIHDISKSLQSAFGDYFSTTNLSVMQKFADGRSHSTIQQIAAGINWEYIPSLLQLKDDAALLFYTKRIHAESLTPDDLSRKILTEDYRAENKTTRPDEFTFRLSELTTFYRNTAELYFGETQYTAFRKLVEPKKDNQAIFEKIQIENPINREIIAKIENKILEFQSSYHPILNLLFNSLFWSIGDAMRQLSITFDIPITDTLVEYCSQSLYKKFPSIFTPEELAACIEFAKRYSTHDEALNILSTVSWDYLKRLIKLDIRTERQLYMANEVLEKGMTISELESKISEGFFEFDTHTQFLPRKKELHQSTTKNIRKGNNNLIITEETIDLKINQKNVFVQNIFKNEALLNFLLQAIKK